MSGKTMNLKHTEWQQPSKKLFGASDIEKFKASVAYARIQNALSIIVQKVKGCEVPKGTLNVNLLSRSRVNTSTALNLPPPQMQKSGNLGGEAGNSPYMCTSFHFHRKFLEIIGQLDTYVDETAPVEGPRRFGNPAFKNWYSKVDENLPRMLKDALESHLGQECEPIQKEVFYYLRNAFGSPIRIDYGTGHELSFLGCVGLLLEIGALDKDKISGTELLVIFSKYYDLTRKFILKYNLEPAGSHGVWGLDDHFHLIYILGASQFQGETNLPVPSVQQVLTSQTIRSYSDSNLYVNAIAFIFRIKSGPFNEHSPILYDIHCSVSSWTKVVNGLLKMYDVEVLGKFPVVQHFWFGGFYAWKEQGTNKPLPVSENDNPIERDKDGFLNSKGINTTPTNISMTGAPWARSKRNR